MPHMEYGLWLPILSPSERCKQGNFPFQPRKQDNWNKYTAKLLPEEDIHWFIHLVSWVLYYVPGTILGAWDMTVNKKKK